MSSETGSGRLHCIKIAPQNRPRLQTSAFSRATLNFDSFSALPPPGRRTPYLTPPPMIGKDLKNVRYISRKIELVQSLARYRRPRENLSSTSVLGARFHAVRDLTRSACWITRSAICHRVIDGRRDLTRMALSNTRSA